MQLYLLCFSYIAKTEIAQNMCGDNSVKELGFTAEQNCLLKLAIPAHL
jgi:hypothetical protein